MKTKVFLLFVALALGGSLPTEAGPKDWITHHKRFLFMEGAALAGAGIHAYGLHHCRQGGVERCDEHYGAAWQGFAWSTGLTVIVLPSAAEGCWKNEGGKFCNLLAYSGSSFQAAWGFHEWGINAPKTNSR